MPSPTGPLILNEDVVLVPVEQLPDETRDQIEWSPGDIAVSRTRGRSGSTIVTPELAELLAGFRQPRTMVEAVILFSRLHGINPEEVLEGSYPVLRRMVEGRVLVPPGQAEDRDAGGGSWVVGDWVSLGRISRTLQILDDTEVYLLSRSGLPFSVLKIARPVGGQADVAVAARFEREAEVLAYVAGRVAPALFGSGELDGRPYVELEFLAGTDAHAAAADCRELPVKEGRRRLLTLSRSIASSYARMHQLGVIHGDVHPRNVIVDRAGNVRLIDFGLAQRMGITEDDLSTPARGGIPFLFEPELAQAYLEGSLPPRATPEGEQFAVAALLYLLLTGAHWQDFRLGREDMLRDIVGLEPMSFMDRGLMPWPELEQVLRRGLAKHPGERFASMVDLVRALDDVPEPPAQQAPSGHHAETSRASVMLQSAELGGSWLQSRFAICPTTSVTYGSAGIALGMLHVAQRRSDSGLLAAAHAWAHRAIRESTQEGAFYNSDIQITPELVGESSPYHSPSGVHAAAALIARATGDALTQAEATARFLEVAERPTAGLDLTTGRCSTLLGAAILLDAWPNDAPFGTSALCGFGERVLADLWLELDRLKEISSGEVRYLGIAHGWAGFLYASLQWCRVAGTPIPGSVPRRLDELAALALPAGRGLEWPWVLEPRGEPATMSGWCNGSAGYVFLWTLASRLLDNPGYLELALDAGWNAWESAEPGASLCCGLAGRGYALLNLYRCVGDPVWLQRARALTIRAARSRAAHGEFPHSLYKGEFGIDVLAAELEEPEEARMPLFEPLGYSEGPREWPGER